MVALETAVEMKKTGRHCLTLCIEDSPLHQYLLKFHLDFKTVPPSAWPLAKWNLVRANLDHLRIKTVLLQRLGDLHSVFWASLFKDIRVVGISHIFVTRKKDDFWHRLIYQKINLLISLTHIQTENIIEHLPISPSKITVIPNWVEPKQFSANNFNSDFKQQIGAQAHLPILGVASRLDFQKGQDTAILAIAHLKKMGHLFQLAIIGTDTLNEKKISPRLRKMAADLGVEDLIFFLGHREDMPQVIASLDLVLVPSHCETFGRVILEAMASQVPVLATAAGGVPDIIKNSVSGYLVPPKNDLLLAERILEIFRNPEHKSRVIENAFNEVHSHFSKKIVWPQLLAAIDGLQSPQAEADSQFQKASAS